MPLIERIRRFILAPEKRSANLLRLLALAVAAILFAITLDTLDSYHEGQRLINEAKADGEDTEHFSFHTTPFWLVICHSLAATLGALGLMVALAMGRTPFGRVVALFLVAIAVTLTWSPADLAGNLERLTISQMGEEPAPLAYFGQQLLTILFFMSPPFVLWAYYSSPLMDRYVLGNMMMPLLLTFTGLIAIWMIMDLTDNGRDFISAGAGFGLLGKYYLVQLPQMVLLVLPITLLLSLLFSLGNMSRANEIISMLGSGLSLTRVLKPLLIAGAYATLICLVLNYEWAPNADARKVGILAQVSDMVADQKRGKTTSNRNEEWIEQGWLYRNSLGQRTWFVGRVPVDLRTGRMRYVAVFWQHGDGKMFRTYRAEYVTWDHEKRIWNFYKCKYYEFDEFGTPKIQYFYHLTVPDWNETPWHVVSSSKKAEFLGVRELTSFLRSNADVQPAKLAPYRTHWHVSWAEPFRCLFIVLMAAPLGVVHSRRGVLGGVAGAITIFFGLIFLDGVFLAVGENGTLPPWLAAWAPNLILGGVGCFLLHLKGRNREMPKLHPMALIELIKKRTLKA